MQLSKPKPSQSRFQENAPPTNIRSRRLTRLSKGRMPTSESPPIWPIVAKAKSEPLSAKTPVKSPEQESGKAKALPVPHSSTGRRRSGSISPERPESRNLFHAVAPFAPKPEKQQPTRCVALEKRLVERAKNNLGRSSPKHRVSCQIARYTRERPTKTLSSKRFCHLPRAQKSRARLGPVAHSSLRAPSHE